MAQLKIKFLSSFLLLSATFSFGICATADKKPIVVCISKSAAHPAIDTTTAGAIQAIKDAGYVEGENLTLIQEDAQGNTGLAAAIANKCIAKNPDIVIAVATVSAQSFAKAAKQGKVKVVFSTVTDPLGANIVDSLNKPGRNTSGASNLVDLEPQITLLKEIQPDLKRLGIIYNAGEINGVKIVNDLKDVCKKLNIELIEQTVTKVGDVPQAAGKLAGSVDAIFISNDNTALSAFQSIVGAALKAKKPIPVYVSDTDDVEKGAVAALGPNQFDVGKLSGRIAIRAIDGEDLGTIPVEFPTKTELYINLKAAKKIGLTIPDSVLKKAVKVIPE